MSFYMVLTTKCQTLGTRELTEIQKCCLYIAHESSVYLNIFYYSGIY